jgi:hypothetical protein
VSQHKFLLELYLLLNHVDHVIFPLFLQTMMLNDRIRSLSALQDALRKAEKHLSGLPADTPYSEFHHRYCIIIINMIIQSLVCSQQKYEHRPINASILFRCINSGSKNLVWRKVGATVLTVRTRLFTFSWTFSRPLIHPPWKSSLEQFQWCSMLSSFLLMVTLLRPMSWGTQTPVGR